MKVPLTIETRNDSILITTNSKTIRKDFPLQPYIVSEKSIHGLECESFTITRIPDHREQTVYKIKGRDLKDLEEKTNQVKAEDRDYVRLPYLEQLFVDRENFPLDYPNTDKLKICCLDIEVLTVGDGIFPKPEKRPIIAIGCSIGREEVKIFDNFQKNDRKILEDFLQWFRKVDPDIVVTYNGESFDIPYIIKRMEINGINPSELNRNWGPILVNEQLKFRGRVHFDCILPARKDQNTFGCKTKGLKDISRWYGYEAKDFGEDIENTKKHIGTEELRKYLRSDVEATRTVARVYLPNAITLAELLKVPLSAVVGCFPSFIPKISIAREYKRRKLLSLEPNVDRYGEVDNDGNVIKFGRLYTLGNKFEGALVGIYKFGLQKNLTKVDFTSQYPSMIKTLNLGPDTTKITNVYEFSGKYKIERFKNSLVLIIPDENFHKDIEVTIDLSKTGLMKQKLVELGNERKKLKNLMKSTKSKSEIEGYDGRQKAIKVLMNSYFGINGSKFAVYGDMATGLTITGMCRWLSKRVINEIKDCLCEADTDGYIINKKVNVNTLNKKIEEWIYKDLSHENHMILEEEPLIDGYFYKMKNYIVRTRKNGKIIIEKHGCAMKSSRHCGLYDKILSEIIDRVLNEKVKDEFLEAHQLMNLKRFPLSDFKYRVTFTKDLPGYGERMSTQRTLGIQVEEKIKTKVEKDLQVDFFVTKEPPNCKPLLKLYKDKNKQKGPFYTISRYIKSTNELDINYYRERVESLFDMFSWNTQPQLSLFS